VDGTAALTACGAASVIDRVAWGTGNCPETAAESAPAANGSIERAPGASDPLCGNGTDTDDNASDFAPRAASEPQNTSSAPESCGGGPGSVGFTLRFVSRTDLAWSEALGATGYKVRRAPVRTFMADHPIPDDTYLIASPASESYQDLAIPTSGECWYYFVNATVGGTESDEDTEPW
jgi:hypothetical protein